MKKNIKILITIMLILVSLVNSHMLFSQVPDPPGNHGNNNNVPAGGGAPIGSGLVILLSLGVAYGGKKLYKMRLSKINSL